MDWSIVRMHSMHSLSHQSPTAEIWCITRFLWLILPCIYEAHPKKYLKYLLIAVVCFLVFAFWPQRKEKEEGHPRDYAEIAADGILHAATEYNSIISFFVDGDTVSGFHYELIEAFARDKGIQAQVSPVMSFDQRLKGLKPVIRCNSMAFQPPANWKTRCPHLAHNPK